MKSIILARRCRIDIAECDSKISYISEAFSDMLYEQDKNIPSIGIVKYVKQIIRPANAYLLYDGKLYFDGHLFYIKGGDDYISCNIKEKHFEINLSPKSDKHAAIGLLQALMNYYMAQYGLLFLHTAAFKKQDKVYAIHAFGGTGKTEVMLCALQDGADFISDDLAIFDADGRIYPYPRAISLHDYPYSLEELKFYGLNERLYRLKNRLQNKKGRLSSILYRKLRGMFNIQFHYTLLTKRTIPMRFYDVDYNYWMETSNNSSFFSIPQDDFVRKMKFCMQNEFAPYINYDGYFGAVLPYWQSIHDQHLELLLHVISRMDVKGIKINGQDYKNIEIKIINNTI